jgi:hypothetical protein
MIKFLRDRTTHIAVVSGVVVAGAAVAALTTGFGYGATAASSPSAGSSVAPVTLQTVTASRLSAIGMYLYQPTVSGTVSESQAENAAAAAVPSSSGVRESALARVVDPNVPQLNGGTFWVESMSGFQAPSAGPPPGVSLTESFMLVFIDPSTGQFVFGVGGS